MMPAQQAPAAAPASLMAVGSDQKQYGPFDVQQFGQGLSSGAFTANTLVWRNGLPNWIPAAHVPELAGYFQPAQQAQAPAPAAAPSNYPSAPVAPGYSAPNPVPQSAPQQPAYAPVPVQQQIQVPQWAQFALGTLSQGQQPYLNEWKMIVQVVPADDGSAPGGCKVINVGNGRQGLQIFVRNCQPPFGPNGKPRSFRTSLTMWGQRVATLMQQIQVGQWLAVKGRYSSRSFTTRTGQNGRSQQCELDDRDPESLTIIGQTQYVDDRPPRQAQAPAYGQQQAPAYQQQGQQVAGTGYAPPAPGGAPQYPGAPVAPVPLPGVPMPGAAPAYAPPAAQGPQVPPMPGAPMPPMPGQMPGMPQPPR